jgi:hypothetical protein
MADVVSNTGPILALVRIKQFELLRQLFGRVIIPPAVRAEVLDEDSLVRWRPRTGSRSVPRKMRWLFNYSVTNLTPAKARPLSWQRKLTRTGLC